MKCDPAAIDELLARFPGAKVMGMAATHGGDQVAGDGKMIDRPREQPAMKRPSKYRNQPTIYNGVRYSSKSEAAQAKVLDREIMDGTVRLWIGQPKFRLGVPENVYIADFFVLPIGVPAYVIDVKGKETAKFKRDKKLWRTYGQCDLVIVRNGKVAEVITPERRRQDVA